MSPRFQESARRLEDLSLAERLAQPDRCQESWYRLVARAVRGLTVLDVGAGTGYGMDILRLGGAARIDGVDPLPLRRDVAPTRIEDVPTGAYDAAVACDVIEHVEDDVAFLVELVRVARRWAFFSTPRHDASRPRNPFHVREYEPAELERLLELQKLPRATCSASPRGPAFSDLELAHESFGAFVLAREDGELPLGDLDVRRATEQIEVEFARWRAVRQQLPAALRGLHVLDLAGGLFGIASAIDGALATIVEPDPDRAFGLLAEVGRIDPDGQRARVVSRPAQQVDLSAERVDVAVVAPPSAAAGPAPPRRWPRSQAPAAWRDPALAVVLEDLDRSSIIVVTDMGLPGARPEDVVELLGALGRDGIAVHPGEDERRPLVCAPAIRRW